ncbi:hypothetical protein [Ralstonia sp. ASV6]|uniref:hypothetical protein n=1 Tax=Ralstonia sp. ASV6 TaxID=2795124 RepID=UPI0018ED0176|nr:hypothetical protein [Ralstonia sp. ASV6]
MSNNVTQIEPSDDEILTALASLGEDPSASRVDLIRMHLKQDLLQGADREVALLRTVHAAREAASNSYDTPESELVDRTYSFTVSLYATVNVTTHSRADAERILNQVLNGKNGDDFGRLEDGDTVVHDIGLASDLHFECVDGIQIPTDSGPEM